MTVFKTKQMCGYELNGHFIFFSEEDAADVIHSNVSVIFVGSLLASRQLNSR